MAKTEQVFIGGTEMEGSQAGVVLCVGEDKWIDFYARIRESSPSRLS